MICMAWKMCCIEHTHKITGTLNEHTLPNAAYHEVGVRSEVIFSSKDNVSLVWLDGVNGVIAEVDVEWNGNLHKYRLVEVHDWYNAYLFCFCVTELMQVP